MDISDSVLTVAANPWAQCSLTLLVRYLLTGAAWAWLLPPPATAARTGFMAWMVTLALNLSVGVPIALLTSLVILSSGCGSLAGDWAAIGFLIAAGMVLGLRRRRGALLRHLRLSGPGMLCFAAGVAVIMNTPHRSEWVLGGWDPGVYVNQGVNVARSHTFHSTPAGAYALLKDHELEWFTRGKGAYLEAFPGVPLDPIGRTWRHYFFRLTPTFIAVNTWSGGLRAAVRSNMIAGFMVCVVFFSLLASNKGAVAHAVFSVALLASHPIWLYHLGVPTSEMLQLFLVCGTGLWLPHRARGRLAVGAIGALVCAAVVNRFSDIPFMCVLVLAVSWMDREREDRRRVAWERAAMVGALAVGTAFDFIACPVTVGRLAFVVLPLLAVAGGFLLLALGLDVACGHAGVRARLAAVPYVVPCAACAVGWVALAAAGWGIPGAEAVSTNLRRLAPYLGYALMAAAAAGSLGFFCRKRPWATVGMAPFTVALLTVAAMILTTRYTSGTYPWTLRRHLVYAVPSVCLLAGGLAAWWWSACPGRGRVRGYIGPYAAVALLLTLIGLNAKRSWHAWSRSEYTGVSAVLAEAAGHMGPRDVVLADHPWWGTPLAMIHSKRVLNGRSFYEGGGTNTLVRGLDALVRLKGEGRRVRFLTSTERGLGVYPGDVGPVSLDWTSGDLVFPEVVHSPRASDFAVREKRCVFRLYTWER